MEGWPHAPPHWIATPGTYFVTAATYEKAHFFRSRKRLRELHAQLLAKAAKFSWQLEAWAVFSNHYHFIARSPEESGATLSQFLKELHGATAHFVNQLDDTSGRRVWHNYRDSLLTYERSYFARLNYVHQNPVKHGLVRVANQYDWCSAAWFEQKASASQVRTVYSFKTDTINVPDEFEVYKGNHNGP